MGQGVGKREDRCPSGGLLQAGQLELKQIRGLEKPP